MKKFNKASSEVKNRERSSTKVKLDPNSPDFKPQKLKSEDLKNNIGKRENNKHVVHIPKELKAYDGSPIIIVENLEDKRFPPGIYGMDTESDCNTTELRLIQIFDGHSVYIFSANALIPDTDCVLTKFMSSKDRIKVGVDIDGDINKIIKHLNKTKARTIKNGNDSNKLRKYKPVTNGFIDLQSIARTFGDLGLSLEKLAHKYVEDFVGNETKLGSYIRPTDDEYIYAANDAILSYRIYFPLINRVPTKRWLGERAALDKVPFDKEEEKTLLFAWIVPLVCGNEPRRISVLVNQIVNSYKRWQNIDRNVREVRAYQYLIELAEEKLFDFYDKVAQTIKMRTIELKSTNSTASNLAARQKVIEEEKQRDLEEEKNLIQIQEADSSEITASEEDIPVTKPFRSKKKKSPKTSKETLQKSEETSAKIEESSKRVREAFNLALVKKTIESNDAEFVNKVSILLDDLINKAANDIGKLNSLFVELNQIEKDIEHIKVQFSNVIENNAKAKLVKNHLDLFLKLVVDNKQKITNIREHKGKEKLNIILDDDTVFSEVLANLSKKHYEQTSGDKNVIDLEVESKYDGICQFLMKMISKEENPKIKVAFVKQIANS